MLVLCLTLTRNKLLSNLIPLPLFVRRPDSKSSRRLKKKFSKTSR